MTKFLELNEKESMSNFINIAKEAHREKLKALSMFIKKKKYRK